MNTVESLSGSELVDVEIFSRAVERIANEMGTVMMRTSGSPVIAEAVDFSTFIADGEGEILAFAGYITLHAGPARQAVRYVLDHTPREEIRPGDAFICNDPHTTGNAHQPDVGVLRPVFAGEELIAWCWAEGHTFDIGGMAPGGFAPMATEVYGEAIRFPGTKFVSEGKPIADIWRLIETNVRVPAMVLNDIQSLLASCNTAESRITELVESYGVDEYRRYVEIVKDLAEEAFRGRVADLPDGTWTVEEWVEHNGHANDLYRLHLRAVVDGTNLTLDFSESAPQTDGFVNCSRATTLGALLTPLVMTVVPDLPINEGTIRAVELITKPGTICDSVSPAPTSSGHLETGLHVLRCVESALAQMQAVSENEFLRDHVMAPWHDCWPAGIFYAPQENGELIPFIDMHGGSGGGGAQPVADGMDVAASLSQPQSKLPDVEINEFQFPVLYLWRRLASGSGGAGRMRGGQGLDLAWTPWYTPGGQEHVCVSSWQIPGPGTGGGYPGSTTGFTFAAGAGVDALLDEGKMPGGLDDLASPAIDLEAKQFGIAVAPGDVVHMHSGGGGGLGDPLDRDPRMVAVDVREGAVDARVAERVFGVVLDDDGEPDEPATEARRDEERAARRAWPADPDGGAGLVRRSPLADRLEELGGWCRPRAGVDLIERADPDSGELLGVEIRVAG